LNKLQRWNESKEAIEDFICNSHETIQRIHAHPAAKLPGPGVSSLVWSEKPGKNMVTVDVAAVVQMILCCGPSLGQIYLGALKNSDACRNCCADVMTRVSAILSDLSSLLTSAGGVGSQNWQQNANGNGAGGSPRSQQQQQEHSIVGAWLWVTAELTQTKLLIEAKNRGDRCFRMSQHAEAVRQYTEALKVNNSKQDNTRISCALLFDCNPCRHCCYHKPFCQTVSCHRCLPSPFS
jgi:hypothetical protein